MFFKGLLNKRKEKPLIHRLSQERLGVDFFPSVKSMGFLASTGLPESAIVAILHLTITLRIKGLSLKDALNASERHRKRFMGGDDFEFIEICERAPDTTFDDTPLKVEKEIMADYCSYRLFHEQQFINPAFGFMTKEEVSHAVSLAMDEIIGWY